MDSLNTLLADLGFQKTYFVEGRHTISDLFRTNRRGIYVLHFMDDEFYIGKATDVCRRYVQHQKLHNDIKQISFKPIPREDLDISERQAIWTFEAAGFQLRNITFTSTPKSGSDFELIMSEDLQERWLTDLAFVDNEGSRIVDIELRRKFHRNYLRFRQMTEAEAVSIVLRNYVQTSVPAIRRGEVSFWVCSCLPSTRAINPKVKYLARLTVNLQEVFVASVLDKQLCFYWYLARLPLQETFGDELQGLEERYPGVIVDWESFWPSGGDDQIFIQINGVEPALKMIHDHDILPAVRLFNLRLMRKGLSLASRFHCLDLADGLV